jgi:hypothetical protein
MANRRTRSKVTQLPTNLVAAINQAMVCGKTYTEIAVMIRGWIAEGQIDKTAAPSRSGVGRYGKDFLTRMEILSRVREQAKAIVTQAAGDGLVLEEAAGNLALNEIITVFMKADPDKGLKPSDVACIATAIGRLQSSSVQREKLKTDFATRAREAVKKITATATKAGVSQATIAEIERDVLKIAR